MRGGMNMIGALGIAAVMSLGGGSQLLAGDGIEPYRPARPRRDPKAPHTHSREVERRLRQEARRAAKAAAAQ